VLTVDSRTRPILVSPRGVLRRYRGPQRPVAVRRGRTGGGIAMRRVSRVILWVIVSVILSVVLLVAIFWVYAIVTGGKNF
jgi:hypothetical protein